MTEEQQILTDLSNTQQRKASAARIASEDDNVSFFGDWSDAISRYGAGETGGASTSSPLNIIRSQAAASVQAMNKVFSAQTTAFNTVRSASDAVMDVFGSMQGLISSLMALDRMLIYQLQRTASFRFRRTLDAYESSCQRIEEHVDAIDEMADMFDGNLFNFDRLIDDWSNRTSLALDSLNESVKGNGESAFTTDSWKLALDELRKISSGSGTDEELLSLFRRFINTYEEIYRNLNEFKELDDTATTHLEDNSLFLDNIKESRKFDSTLKRAISEAKSRVGAASSGIGELSGGCRYNPPKILHNLSQALGEIDASVLVLGKADSSSLIGNKDSYFNMDNLNLNSPCGLVAFKAYLDDVKLAKEKKPDIQMLTDLINEYLSILALESTAGNTTGREKRKRKKAQIKEQLGICGDWKNNADDAHTAFINDPLHMMTDGLIGPLAAMARMGDGVETAMNYISSAKIFSITTYREFLQMFPAGRLYLIVIDCLGVSDKLGFTDSLTVGEFSTLASIRDSLDKFSSNIDSVTSKMAEMMADAFGWLNKLDSEIAEFISALVSLLFFCDQQQSFTSFKDGDFTLYRSPAQKTVGDIYSKAYNDSSGENGTAEMSNPGDDEDACRC